MGRIATTGKGRGRRPAGRTGRPPRELAGGVESRILDAARRVFLERGLAGASMDEIAGFACAGKPTIYARFPSKEALFTAVIMQSVAANIARYEDLRRPARQSRLGLRASPSPSCSGFWPATRST